jgi:hypothetical protein
MKSKDVRGAFISYRRLDTDALAGRLRDRLREALPNWAVFMDVDSIEPGTDFRLAVRDSLKQSSLFLLLIGRNFRGEGGGINRLMQPEDNVVYEIETALGLGLRIIPILVNDAVMPRPEDFPAEAKPVVYRAAIEMRHARFEDDFRHLVKVIVGNSTVHSISQSQLSTSPTQRKQPWTNSAQTLFRSVKIAVVGGMIGITIGLVALGIVSQTTKMAASEWIGDNRIAVMLLPAVAIIGAITALYLSRQTH